MTRNYNDLSAALIDVIPSTEELTALSDSDIEKLRRLGNSLDNALYLELRRRAAVTV